MAASEGKVEAKVVALVGGTGQIGKTTARGLAKDGHKPVVITRSKSERNAAWLEEVEKLGGSVAVTPFEEAELTEVFKAIKPDVVIVTTRASKSIILTMEPKVLAAAKAAGVKRFVPCEFGVHTAGLEDGTCTLFDAKRKVGKVVEESGLEWTRIFTGGFAHYFLPSWQFRDGPKLKTFGDLDIKIPTHDINDIGALIAKVIVDDRTVNKYVQFEFNWYTQRQALELLKKNFPGRVLADPEHESVDEIEWGRKNASETEILHGGAEPERERFGINYVVYVAGTMANPDFPGTLRASVLYPDFKFVTTEELLADESFVFAGKDKDKLMPLAESA